MAQKRKWHWGDRNDAYLLNDSDPMHVIIPYIMPDRADNEAVLGDIVETAAMDEYLQKKNADNPDFKYTWFHVICAAIAKTFILKPKLNYFYTAKRLYEHKEIQLSFIARREFNERSQEAVAICKIDPDGGSLVDQVHDYVQKFVKGVRTEKKVESTTKKMGFLSHAPRFLLKIFFGILDTLDYFGIYPLFLRKDDPRYCSVFISNLGSIKMNADYHHLYNKGTCSFFTAIGEKKARPLFKEDGSFEMRDTIKLSYTIDERIADGYYYAKSIQIMRYLLQHPDLLDLDASTPLNVDL